MEAARGLDNLDPMRVFDTLISLLEKQEGIEIDYTVEVRKDENNQDNN